MFMGFILCLICLLLILLAFLFPVFTNINLQIYFSGVDCLFNDLGYFSIGFNNISLICFLMLLICGSLSLNFSQHYMGDKIKGLYLFLLMFTFLLVMIGLVFTNSLLLSLIFWEYLGLVSFLLILYYGNSVSLRAAIITMSASRIGDLGFFFIVCYFFSYSDSNLLILAVFIFLIISSKSASYPFISWLLEAMRAPTPVSALVHSSTLVAAGVWFGSCYNNFLVDNYYLNMLLLISSFLTIFITGLCSLLYIDLKKIVALSTSNNISWCLIYLLLGDVSLSLIQLLTHGVAKCLLFIIVGDMMSSTNSSQTYYNIYSLKGFWYYTNVIFLVVCLSGLPFLGLFFSKHSFFVEIFNNFNCIFMIFSAVGLLLTCAYSSRIILLCCVSYSSHVSSYNNNFYFIFILIPFISIINFISVFVLESSGYLGLLSSLFLYLLQVIGFLLGLYVHNNYFIQSYLGFWLAEIFGLNILVNYFRFFLDNLLVVVNLGVYRWDSLMIMSIFNYITISGFIINLLISISLLSFSLLLFLFLL